MKQNNVKPHSQIMGTKRGSESFVLKYFAAAISISSEFGAGIKVLRLFYF